MHDGSRHTSLISRKGFWCLPSGPVWIPDQYDELQLRLCIIAHNGAAGHRGVEFTKNTLSHEFHWRTLDDDVQLFVFACIHCLLTTGGGKIPGPFCPSVHGTCPNELLQFDYLELGLSRTGEKYAISK